MMSDQPTNHKEIIALIKKISGQANFIGTPRIYVDIFYGDLVAAVWFNQAVYWDDKSTEPIGFYKTYAEWKTELGLSEYQVRRVSTMCQQRGLVNITFRKVYGTPKNHYLVIWPELLKVIYSNLKKLDPEETEGSETSPSEGEESTPSMEGEQTSGSLSIEEITTKSLEKELTTKIWQSLIDQLGHDRSNQLLLTHVQATRPSRYDGNTFVVTAPNEQERAWLVDRFQSTAERLLVGILRRSVDVEFVTE